MTCGQALYVHAIEAGKFGWDGYALIFDAKTELALKARAPDEGTILYGLITDTTWTKCEIIVCNSNTYALAKFMFPLLCCYIYI